MIVSLCGSLYEKSFGEGLWRQQQRKISFSPKMDLASLSTALLCVPARKLQIHSEIIKPDDSWDCERSIILSGRYTLQTLVYAVYTVPVRLV